MILGILFLFQKEENLLDADGFTKKKFGLDGKVDKHKALEPKSEKCIFVGYSEYVKRYRLIQPKSKN